MNKTWKGKSLTYDNITILFSTTGLALGLSLMPPL